MSNNFRLNTLARAAALTLALAGFANAAYADDEYGTGHEKLVQQAARSAPTFSNAFALATGRAADSQTVAGNAGASVPAVRSDASAPTVKQDLLGTGGQQDSFAREIYHPGSGTDW
jgi:transcription elongation factor